MVKPIQVEIEQAVTALPPWLLLQCSLQAAQEGFAVHQAGDRIMLDAVFAAGGVLQAVADVPGHMNGANHVALVIGQALIVDLVQGQLPVLLRHGHFHHETVAFEGAVPESLDKPSFVGEALQCGAQVASGFRPEAEGNLELATEGTVEMQQV